MELFLEGVLHAVGAVFGVGIAMGMMPRSVAAETTTRVQGVVEDAVDEAQDLFAQPAPARRKRRVVVRKKAAAKRPRRKKGA